MTTVEGDEADIGNARNSVEMEQLSPLGERFADKQAMERDGDYDGELTYSVMEERAVIRKLDRRVVLLVAFLYMLSFLDRSNIGNARIAGLVEDLKLSDGQYEWLLTGFYITYIAFEWMALLFRLIPAHIYLSVVVMSWGMIASLQSLTHSFTPLLVLRTVLGLAEAAFSGVPFYLSFFYRREELALRTGLFVSAAPLATSFASTLAWTIQAMAESGPIAPWRLLFLIEGFPSVLVAWYCWTHVADGPETAWFLTEKQKVVAIQRLRSDRGAEDLMDEKGSGKKQSVKFNEVLEALSDPKCYITAAMFFSCNVAFSSMPVFLPTIIEQMGYSSLSAQGLSAPPYLVSFVVVLVTAYLSDKHAARSPYIMFHSLLATCGYLTIFLSGLFNLPNWIRYLGLYPATAGFFSAVTLIITWQLNNQDSDSKKGTGIAILQFFGQCGPLLGTRLFPDQDAPLYSKGMIICAGFMAVVGVLAGILRIVLQKANKQRINQATTQDSAGDDVEAPLVGDDEDLRKGVFLFMI